MYWTWVYIVFWIQILKMLLSLLENKAEMCFKSGLCLNIWVEFRSAYLCRMMVFFPLNTRMRVACCRCVCVICPDVVADVCVDLLEHLSAHLQLLSSVTLVFFSFTVCCHSESALCFAHVLLFRSFLQRFWCRLLMSDEHYWGFIAVCVIITLLIIKQAFLEMN